MKKVLLTIMVAAVATAFLAAPAGAQQPDYPDVGVITLSDASIDCPSGEALTITGEGFIPNEPAVRIFFDGEQVAEVFPDSQGNFSVTVDPPGAAAGQHTIEARQAAEPEDIVATATLTCIGAAVAFTGANISMWVILLVALLVIGGGALLVGRRRARQGV